MPTRFKYPHQSESVWDHLLNADSIEAIRAAGQAAMALDADNQRALEDYLVAVEAASLVPTTARGFSAYGHGAIAARILQKFTVGEPILLTAIDVYLQTAPAGTTGAAHGNVKVSGSVSGSYTMPIAVNGTKEYHTSAVDLAIPFGAEVPTVGAANYSGGSISFQFSLSASHDLRAIAIGFGAAPAGAGTDLIRVGIASGMTTTTSIAGIPWLNGPDGPAWVELPISAITAPGYTLFDLGQLIPLGTSATYNVIVHNKKAGGDSVNAVMGTDGTVSGTVVNQGLDFGTATNGDDTRTFFINMLGNDYGDFKLYGDFTGLELTGLVIVEQTLTGAPATPGADMNVAIQV